jgi:hypothetical protein
MQFDEETNVEDPTQQTPSLVLPVNLYDVSAAADKLTVKVGAVHCDLTELMIKKLKRTRLIFFILMGVVFIIMFILKINRSFLSINFFWQM